MATIQNPKHPETRANARCPASSVLKVRFSKAIWASDLNVQDKLDSSKASLHWLRHTCGTRALDRGVSIETVQRQLGHSDARATMRYAKPQLERVQAEMERGFR